MARLIAVCLSLALNVGWAWAADPPKPSRGPLVLTDQARALHASALVIDGHNDLPWELRTRANSSFVSVDLNRLQPKYHTDIPRLKQGGVGGVFWSVYVPGEAGKDGTAVRMTLEQIDVVHRLVRQYPDTFCLARTADDIVRARQKGRIASMIGIEGGHSIDRSLGTLRMMHALGVGYMTLTHSESLDWADSATDAPRANGLSPLGEQVVAEMNRLGMLVDISHVSAATMKHALRVSRAPVIASHSSAYAVAAHPRNVPDDVLELIKLNRGLVMVNFYPGFIHPEGARMRERMFEVGRELKKQYPDETKFREALQQWQKEHPVPPATIHYVLDHIDHIVRVAGVDCVGLGSDFDGIPSTPEQLEDVSKYPYLTQGLLDRGYTPEQILKILGGNILRVMREAERIAAEKR